MKNLEFRIWDKKQEKFLPEGQNRGEVLIDLNGKIRIAGWPCGNGDNSANSVFEPLEDQDRYVLQISTGLKDKNGRSIFEGDIVKEHHFDDWGDEKGYEYIGVVRHKAYSIDRMQFSRFITFPNLRENKDYAGQSIRSNCEIIGNIYENPDLLCN